MPDSTALSAYKCEPHRAFIDAQLRLGRNAMAIYQALVDRQSFDGSYNSVQRFAVLLRYKQPEQSDHQSFQPSKGMQVDYCICWINPASRNAPIPPSVMPHWRHFW